MGEPLRNVAKLVDARGAEFNMTLDHSHVIFKIDNPRQTASEQAA